MHYSRSRLKDYALLALVVLLAYWPLSSFQHITRWDSIEVAFPPRYFLSDCLRHGCWPFWNPYQFNGLPFYGDPQSGAWYPIAWLLALVVPYGFASFIIEHLLIFFISAAGMYELARGFSLMRASALMAGIGYSASGFFVGNAEHFTWLIAAAWIPWVFWSYHQMMLRGKTGYALLAGFFLFLMFTGGYPSFFVTTAYLLCLFFLVVFAGRMRSGRIMPWLKLQLWTLLTFLTLSAGFIVSLSQVMPHITRSDALDMRRLLAVPFTPHSFVSLLLPFSTLKDDSFFATDISMRNIYIGMLPLLLLPFSWRPFLRKKVLWLVAALTLVCLAASLASCLPVRRWMALCLPLMDMFKFAAFFRVFAIIGLLLLAAFGFDELIHSTTDARKRFMTMIGILAAVYASALAYSAMKHGWLWGWGTWAKNFEPHLLISIRQEHVQLQAVLQLALLAMLLAAVLRRKEKLVCRTLVTFCALDMILATSLNAFGTVVYPEFARDIERPIVQTPRGFPVPDNSIPVWNNRDGSRDMGLLSSNAGVLLKLPSPNGYNPAQLRSFDRLERSAIHGAVWSNPYLYFASSISAAPDTAAPLDKREVRVDASDYRVLSRLADGCHAGQIHVRVFTPDCIGADAVVADSSLLNLQQCIFKGWHCYVDGIETNLYRSNYAQMAVVVPPGKHSVQWMFRPWPIKACMISGISVFVALLTVLFGWRKKLFGEVTAPTEG